MSDIQVTIQPTSNVSVEVTVPSNTVRELHIPVAPKITVVENASVIYQSGTNINNIDDIPDVSFSSLTDGQILGYDSDTQSWVNVDQSLGALESAINITNEDNAFDHMTTPISAGTSFEAILRDMLEKYNVTTITLSAFKAAYQNTDGTYPSTVNKTTNATLEVGRGVKSDGFSFSIADTSQTADTSVLFKVNGTTVASGISETGSPATYTTDIQEVSSPTIRYYRVEATDNGSGTDNTISSQKSITWRWLVKLGASSTSAIADNDAAQTLYDGVTEMATNLNSGSSWNNVSTTSDGNSQSNYTYIIFPASFGALQNVVQNNALSVLDAFEDLGDFTIDNQYGVSVSYSFYRTNQTAAFGTGTELDITF